MISPSNVDALHPETIEELRGLILDHPRVLVRGRCTKGAIPTSTLDPAVIAMDRFEGVLDYQPSEFVFTAMAGTTLAEISEMLATRRQTLPFDPPLVRAGATLGGTVAAAMNGPGRHRFGGVRDFILGADFLTGDGKMIRSGGSVVKNAAGFDFPKLMIGSLGQLAAMVNLTFKVFPKSETLTSFEIRCVDHAEACRRIGELARGRWEFDAIDYDARRRSIWLRLPTTTSVASEMKPDIERIAGELKPLDPASWQRIEDLALLESDGLIFRFATRLEHLNALSTWADEHPDDASVHGSAAGGLTWLAASPCTWESLATLLETLNLSCLLLRGNSQFTTPSFHDRERDAETNRMWSRIKSAMDPDSRFILPSPPRPFGC
ncbi:MAG: FAD-binding protein [Planctomycetota bacterium]